MTAKPEIGPALAIEPSVSLGVVQASRPAELVRVATEAAHALASVIEDRKLYSTIQGKRFVRAEDAHRHNGNQCLHNDQPESWLRGLKLPIRCA